MKCSICPRNCSTDRVETLGFCRADITPEAATICIHRGEEPAICGEKGICNVFFSHCNLQCVYCQNHEISTHAQPARFVGVEAIVQQIASLLPQTENIVGFVTPSHYANHIPAIVERLHALGLSPTIVYNTGGYDSVTTLRTLAPYIDIYLPDYKYSDPKLALRYSHAADYPQVALAALREMYYQKGSPLLTDDNGLAYSGIIVRHLVLPGQIENSLGVLENIADISTNLHLSLMSQYFPPLPDLPDLLGRTLTEEEYQRVTDHFYGLGLHNGWVQQLDSQACYRPDFSRQQAFEN